MPSAPRLKVLSVDLFESPYRLRLPFRFGVITVTEGRQAIARVRIRHADGREDVGYAAEALGAKWFDKNPALSDAQNHDQLRRALELTRDAYLAAPPLAAFALHAHHYRSLLAAGAAQGLDALVCSFGPALLDRAVLDALLRIEGLSFWRGMQCNLPGIVADTLAPDLQGFAMDEFLRSLQASQTMHVRHTVGLLDPLVAADQGDGTRVDDGLPETLEEVVRGYGNRYFKLKVSGRLDADLDRLQRIASVLDRSTEPYAVTLDGNEQFDDAQTIAAMWQQMLDTPALQRLCASTLLVEQPIRRSAALSRTVAPLARFKPVIIDESDGDLDAFVQARALGYTGVSSKACKGFYKSVLNLARCRRWNGGAAGPFFMSAEDLTTQAGVSVQQDLALVSLLGLSHVERNAHHFIDGFAGRPAAEAQAYLQAHPDLYHLHAGRPHLHIQGGVLQLASLDGAGFGSGVAPVLDDTAPMPPADWPPAEKAAS
ncbi:MAG: mandelate racemase [Rhodoferax sp.]|nr:mandelate racemase [Rhodoferax sp.]